MTQTFESQRLCLDVDFEVIGSPRVEAGLFEAASGGVENVRVILRRDGRELDLTPYLNEREIEDAYEQADELVPDDYDACEQADFDYDRGQEAD